MHIYSLPIHICPLPRRTSFGMEVYLGGEEAENGVDRDLTELEVFLLDVSRRIDGMNGHCDRVAKLAANLALRLGLASEMVFDVRKAGFLHDVGKIAVSASILKKPGALTAEEWHVVRQHPVVGEKLCAGVPGLASVLPIIRHHHERFDGSGYPDGLRGSRIPLAARVLQIADVFDALTEERSYKPAFTPFLALEIMESEVARGFWDPELFAEFQPTVLVVD